jgi:hypothetical protein
MNYYYSLKAFDSSFPNASSAMSEMIEIYSHDPAGIISTIATTPRNISVIFDSKIKNTIENLESFSVEGFGSPNSITAGSQFSYLLSFTEPLPSGDHALIVEDLKDFYDSPIARDTVTFRVEEVIAEESLFISSYEVTDNYSVLITFNLDLDPLSAQNINNYSFTPENAVREISMLQDAPNQVLLRTINPISSVGKEYTLKISNITSSVSTGGIKISDGAGGFIVLTSFSENLDDIYVYPNPVRIGEGHNSLTFANLTKKAEIIIFTVDGKKITTLNETDGNGGITWDLRNNDGELVSSGIYIYRITALDDADNEKEDKVEKFAIIR